MSANFEEDITPNISVNFENDDTPRDQQVYDLEQQHSQQMTFMKLAHLKRDSNLKDDQQQQPNVTST